MAKPKRSPRKRRRSTRRGDHMTPREARAFMDRWAAEQNDTVVARDNIRALLASIERVLCTDEYEDGPLEGRQVARPLPRPATADEVIQLLSRLAMTGKRHHTRPRKGGRPRTNEDRRHAEAVVRRLHARAPGRDYDDVTRTVADDLDLKVKDVRRWCRLSKLRW